MSEQMRVTIIPSDTFCSVDGVGFVGVDMTSVPATLHAVQWYGTWGEQEFADPVTGRIILNEEIQNLDAYQAVMDSYWAIRNAEEAAQQEATEEETIVEV
jgi:hypothetical protein